MTETVLRSQLCDDVKGVSCFPDCGARWSGTNLLASGLEHIGSLDDPFQPCCGDDFEYAAERKIREESK